VARSIEVAGEELPPPGESTGPVGYTGSMKTAISIPDAVVESAERLAQRAGRSLEEIYSDAIEEYVERHSPDSITERINAVCAEVDTRPDPFVSEAASRVLATSEW